MRITGRQLRQIIREELIREAENPGDMLSSAEVLAGTRQKQAIEDAMNDTADWFQNDVVAALETDSWPVRAPTDLLWNPVDKFLSATRQQRAVNPARAGAYIPAGTKFDSLDDEQPMRDDTGESMSLSLRHAWARFKEAVDIYDLSVILQSDARDLS